MVNLEGFNVETGEWNDSLTGDFVWGNANIGEALSCVVTPYTWSNIGAVYEQMTILPGYHLAGNIGGRPYQNGSVVVSVVQALGKDVDAVFQEMGGREEPPAGLTIPTIPVPWWGKIPILLNGVRLQWRERAGLRRLPHFLATNPGWCAAMRQHIAATTTASELLELLPALEAHSRQAFWCTVALVYRFTDVVAPLRRDLIALVGEADAGALLSGISSEDDMLASLGPVVGLSHVARGAMTRQAYMNAYGHRGPYEAEFSVPRPAEDAEWLEQQLALWNEGEVDVDAMLARQRAASTAAWDRFRLRFPDLADGMQERLREAAEVGRQREASRSELTRQVWPGRMWALRAGALTGLGDDIFYLVDGEVRNLLQGKPAPVSTIRTRKETYEGYRALPPYPPIISGQFDPFAWAADPQRRNDVFDAHAPDLPFPRRSRGDQIIRGVPGSAGIVEGRVRRIDSPEEADQLQPGEILVTNQTNVGWTVFFPLAAAVVTDVGAPLSHAAVVARELGIPAVVGCGDATAQLKTGDWVRVDGASGLVEHREPAEEGIG